MSDLLARVDDDRELLRELFSIFESLYPTHLDRLREATHLQDASKIEIESHALKGMLANLSAKRAASVASQLERPVVNKSLTDWPKFSPLSNPNLKFY